MHSSRMRTVRSSGRISGGVLSPGGSAPGGVSASRGCLLRGVLLPGVSAPGGVSAQGVGIPACTEADTPTPPWTDRCL